MGNRLKHTILAACVTATLFLGGCGQNGKKYGVLIWSENEAAMPTGTIVLVVDESQLNNTYTIRLQDSRERTETARWRILVFDSADMARQFQEKTAKYVPVFAKALRNALPLRSEPNQGADRVYKLRDGQVVKVIDRSDTRSAEGIYTGYWYRVLTDDGVLGYCFDQSIEIIDNRIATDTPDEESQDPALDSLLSRSYVPETFLKMIQSRRIRLESVNPDAGLFPIPDAKTIRIAAPHGSYSFVYTDIVSPKAKQYIFSGTTLNITILSERTIQADYSVNGLGYSEVFSFVETPVSDILAAEKQRREEIYQSLMARGPRFDSTAYGYLLLSGNGRFTWDGYQRLIPGIIPRDLGPSGTVAFSLFLGDQIREKYDGILTLRFDRESGRSFSFLYSATDQGLRLLYVPETAITEGVVNSDTGSPFVIFFTASR